MTNEEEVVEKDDEVVESEVEEVETTEETEEETTDWEEKFKKEEGRRKRAETKLSKSKTSDTKPPKSENKDGLDYGQEAFLIANGIKGSKESDFVKEELEKAGGELRDLLENEYFKNRLEEFRAINKTSDAIPKKTRSGKSVDSLDYWMTKPMSEVPKDLRAKVVNARLKKDENKGNFYNSD